MKLTIIIPVYKTEQTLERCVESVLKQQFRDYQLILVDDGSPDGCPALCDQLMQRDRRIQVVHKKNGGLSDARNAGIKKAKGEYVTFIDSDDYIADNTLEPLMDLLAIHHDYDILEYSVYEHFGRPKHMNVLRLDNREYSDMRKYWYEARAYEHSYACNKIYRRELFDEVAFPVGRKFEDAHTLPKLLSRCQMVATTSMGYYYYCYNTEGITVQASGQDLDDLLQAHLQVLNAKADNPLAGATAHYYARVLNVALDVYALTGRVPQLPPFSQVCAPGEKSKATLKMKLQNLIGISNLCRINKVIHKAVTNGR